MDMDLAIDSSLSLVLISIKLPEPHFDGTPMANADDLAIGI